MPELNIFMGKDERMKQAIFAANEAIEAKGFKLAFVVVMDDSQMPQMYTGASWGPIVLANLESGAAEEVQQVVLKSAQEPIALQLTGSTVN